MEMQWMKIREKLKVRLEIKILIGILLAGLAVFLLRDDSKDFLVWWLMLWILG